MPSYRYVAKNWEGQTNQGTHSAGNLKEALDFLRGQNLFVVSIKEQAGLNKQASLLEQIKESGKKKKAKSRDFMVFCRQFTTMIQAGITVLQILKIQAEQVEHKGFQERLKDVALSVEKGSSLTDALEKHRDFFPHILITMIEAGEAGGILDTVLDRLAVHFEKQHELEEKIRSATTYPLIISVVAFLVMNLMIFFVLPQFSKIFEDMGFEMPFFTRALLTIAHFGITYWYIVIAMLILLAVFLIRYLKSEAGKVKLDETKIKLPVFGPIYMKMVVARFARTLSTLLSSGVPLVSSLELAEKIINNAVYARTLDNTRQVIRQGQTMALPLAASGHFPPMMVEMIHVGEETGALDGMLSRVADFYEQEVSFVLDRLGSIIEPIMMIGIGIFVGALVVSIIQPMFQIYDMF